VLGFKLDMDQVEEKDSGEAVVDRREEQLIGWQMSGHSNQGPFFAEMTRSVVSQPQPGRLRCRRRRPTSAIGLCFWWLRIVALQELLPR
jgi:hypothetical protein